MTIKRVLEFKKKYLEQREILFKKLVSNNDGFIFNDQHTELVDSIVKNLIEEILSKYDLTEYTLVAVGGYGRHDLSPKSDVDLLFIYKKNNKNIRSFITDLNNSLWDVGLEVGISFLTIKQAIIDAKKDIKTITKFAETRYLAGDQDQYGEFVRSIKILIGKVNALKLSEYKLLELVERHDFYLGIKSNLEPQIKEGVGGLRDIHTILWISIFMFNIHSLEELQKINIFTGAETKELKQAWKFLLTVRAFIHYFNDSKGDTLSIENQLKIAKKLEYRNTLKEKGVERFMKHLFIQIARIESLLNTFYSKLPEDLIIKTIYKRKPTKTRNLSSKFVMEKGFINLRNYSSKNFYANWLGVFEASLEQSLFVHPRFLKTLEEKRKFIKKQMNLSQYQALLKIIGSKKNPITVLRNLNDTRILNELFPEFGRIWGQVQFDIYHHYTTDEHLLLTLHQLSELKKQTFYKEIYSRLQNPIALHTALLFHDIGKKGPKNHAIYGKELVEKIFKRLPVDAEDQKLCLWLIEHHLLMSDIAFKNDPQDPDVIANFTSTANSQEKINALFLFTLCDIASVGPGVLNEWRVNLLRSIFFNSKDFLNRGLDTANYSSAVQSSIQQHVLDKADAPLQKFIKKEMVKFPLPFWEAFSARMIIDIFKIYQSNQLSNNNQSVSFLNYEHTEYGAVVVMSKNRSGILKDIVSGFTHSQANILGSRVVTLNNEDIIDVFWVCNSSNRVINEHEEQARLKEHILRGVNNENLDPYKPLFPKKSKIEVDPVIRIDNSLSKLATTFQIQSSDRQGLLMDILKVFHEHAVSVQSAKISTYGEKVFDIFQVTDLNHKKIKDEENLKSLEKKLMSIL